MAKLKLSGFLSGVSGRSGNAVYRYTKNGTELCDRPFVNNPKSAAQTAVRSAFSKVTKQWKSLSSAQAAAWNAYAASITETEQVTGAKTKRSGFNWFVSLGARYLWVNEGQATAPTTPPTTAFTGDSIKVTASAVAGGIKFTASAANTNGVTTALQVQKLSSANGKPGAKYTTKAHMEFKSGTLEKTISVPPGTYAVAIQYVSLATGQETVSEAIGKVGPVSFVLAGTDTNSKKKAA